MQWIVVVGFILLVGFFLVTIPPLTLGVIAALVIIWMIKVDRANPPSGS